MSINLDGKTFLVTGGTGFLGKNLIPELERRGATVDSFGSNFDLTVSKTERDYVDAGFDKSYDYIIHAAAVQGAGTWPLEHKAESFDLNLRIHVNILDYWKKFQPNAKLLGMGSTCSYPGNKSVLVESEYWDGPMHESVDVYGLTKKALNVGINAYKSQYGLSGTVPVFATLYGPHDSFDEGKAHVVSALVKKFVDAKRNNLSQVEVWGDGTQTRELIHVRDQINGLLTVLDYDGDLINIGTGVVHTIRELAETIQRLVDYDGEIFYNTNRFVGVKHKVQNIQLAKNTYGWTTDIPLMSFEEGIKDTINWYSENYD